MQPYGLFPEEKLICAIFGEPSYREDWSHWLTDLDRTAINDFLDGFAARLHGQMSTTWCERGVKILRLRFGFEPRTSKEKAKRPYPSDTRTLEEVAVYFNVTRERIRQIENKMLRFLRHPSSTTTLRQYIHRRN